MISIVIPARHEVGLNSRIDRLVKQFPGIEIVLVEVSPAPLFVPTSGNPVKYVHAPELKTRAEAMNLGASKARNETLWFLHSDCFPPDDGVDQIQRKCENGARAGAFLKEYSPSTPLLQFQIYLMNLAARKRRWLLVGTNGFFIDRSLFFQCGGFPAVPLLEDVLMFDRLRAEKRFAVIDSKIRVSSRKYEKLGGIPRQLRNLSIYAAFRFGVSTKRLANWYG